MNPTETAKQILLQIVDGVVNTSFNKLVAESSDIVPEGTAGVIWVIWVIEERS